MIKVDRYSWKKVSTGQKSVIVIMILSLYLTKPMIAGANLTPIAMIILGLMALMYISIKKKICISNRSKIILLSISAFYIYNIVQSIVLSGSLDYTIFNAVVSIMCIILCYSILFNDTIIEHYFFRIYIITLIVFVISYILTFLISFFIPLSKLLLFTTVIARYGYVLNIYFPFTVANGILHVEGITVVRQTAFLRECGIAQAFYIWAYITCEMYFIKYKRVKLLMFLGLIFCLSTTGFINVLTVLALDVLLNLKGKKKTYLFVSVGILVLLYWGFMNVQGIRLEDKNIISYEARIGMLNVGIEELAKRPVFGSGYSNIYIKGTATSFLQRAYTIGLVGLFLYLNIFMQGLLYSKNKKMYVLAITPVLSTILFAQPIEAAPLIFLFLIHNYDRPKYYEVERLDKHVYEKSISIGSL